MPAKTLKQEILDKVKEYHRLFHQDKKSFIPGQTRIPYAGRVFDEAELLNLVDSSLEFWLTSGRYSQRFEKELAGFLGLRHCALTNSGSSANLLAFMALTSQKLGGRRIMRGDEVITVAACFPTTVAPIIQYGAVPVFVDIDVETLNLDVKRLEDARSERTKAVMLAHTLGNPFDIKTVKEFCARHELWLVEDNCDSLGSKYNGRFTGTFGDIGTSSFYPPHHITTGEGGAVYTDDSLLARIVESFRDWGRDCWCSPGKDNTCGKRFGMQFGGLPSGYDHKYVYSHFGYNLKATDMQAAIGCAQLEKLNGFISARRHNWQYLRDRLKGTEDIFVLPKATDGSEPSWFGFLLTLREGASLTRDEIVNELEANNIQTRMLFAGNIIKHPCFDELRNSRRGYRVVGDLKNTDIVMKDSFWVGVYPGMNEKHLDYIARVIRGVAGRKKAGSLK